MIPTGRYAVYMWEPSYDSIRHEGGESAGRDPTGWVMPAYIAQDRDQTARNGEDPVVEYLLLSQCNYIVHNGSSLARTVLLKVPAMRHSNTHGRRPSVQVLVRRLISGARRRVMA